MEGVPDPAQVDGLSDMDPATFRAAAHAVVDLMADYLATIEGRAVFPLVEPGSLRPEFPGAAPDAPEALDAILADYERLVPPAATHWQHPGFMAYFATTASGPGILGEMLTAVLGQNPMLWRTSPIGTELEEVVVDWLRIALGLPDGFDGLMTDTASTSSLIALAAAREAAGIRADRVAGRRPIAIVATIGTTSSTAVDPVASIADIAAREGLWRHVDAAYAGAVALIPERRAPFEGWDRADSIVINPHKWLFTPLDASLLLTRRMQDLRAAFSLVPEYLRTLDRATPVRDYNEYQPQLGRRFRALKLWMQLRWFGLDGLRRRIERHIRMAHEFAAWIDDAPDWERLAPVPFSTVCFRWNPGSGVEDAALDAGNEAIMDAVNRTGDVFLSHTRLDGQFTIRLSVGNLRTEPRHVAHAWELLREAASEAAGG